MRKTISIWRVSDLSERYSQINFPEYQREPTLWARVAKQRLIDSMLRQFDIASLYLYDNEDGSFDCVDGRQRIGAIMAFLGLNIDDEDNAFEIRTLNEIFDDNPPPFAKLVGQTYQEISRAATQGTSPAKRLVQEFNDYKITVVTLAGAERPEEFNLQFTRLNLGTIINSGEKLHAMVGDMRDVCFDKDSLSKHPFLEDIGIPTRRYSKEQVAAQLLAQVFALARTGEYTRTRHFDLQRFFKEYSSLSSDDKKLISEVRLTLDALQGAFEDRSILRNRAITISVVLMAWRFKLLKASKAREFAEFVQEFVCRLKWQVEKGLDVDDEYRYLIDFQRHVTQASVEKPAVQARAMTLESEYALWTTKRVLAGDPEFKARTKLRPSDECRKA
jgi:hypothetical protein